jgi:small subunit ribosomal protein S20
LKAMRRLITAKDAAGAQAALPQTFSVVDRAAKWGIIKKNTAARYKSRLTANIKSFSASAA